ncbi:hypothetical protein MMC22_009946 [Lobaria immixta]|nr:hypothetical protein [Lobaria immixta]
MKEQATSQAMWETLRKAHGAQGQGRLNFLRRKLFDYKARAAESIDDISGEFSRLHIIIRDIKETEAPTDSDVALTLVDLDETNPQEDIANKASAKGKVRRTCFLSEKLGHIKETRFKKLATKDGKEYTKNNPTDGDKDDKAKQANRENFKDSSKRSRSKPLPRR